LQGLKSLMVVTTLRGIFRILVPESWRSAAPKVVPRGGKVGSQKSQLPCRIVEMNTHTNSNPTIISISIDIAGSTDTKTRMLALASDTNRFLEL
jgi:hypothetical protein